jgi:hypothetical protein
MRECIAGVCDFFIIGVQGKHSLIIIPGGAVLFVV